ncbi:NAD dependent epimerase [Dipodascopsis tothii]|uniref:NAD dependent epimerase n=1 Tax=Dipodascopsis tothii TaxID=44089 RepID=UPI0034CEA98B
MSPSYVLVTGGTGFIGAHVVDCLLRRGLKVRIATRSAAKAEIMKQDRPEHAHLIDYVTIDDFEKEGVFHGAAKGCDGIIHVASPFSYDVTDVEKELIIPAINGVKAIMEAAASEPAVQRVVLTSSFASVLDVARGPGPGFTYTGADWNPLTYEESVKADPVVAYRGSKKYAEKAAWDFVEAHKGSINFDLVTLCPPMTFGPIVHPVRSVKELNVSNAMLWDIAEGVSPLPVSRVPVWIDVRDLAEAHVQALLTKEVGGRRYVPAAPDFFSYQLAADIMRAKFDWAPTQVTKGNEGEPIPESYTLDGAAVARELSVTYHTFPEMVVDALTQFRAMPRE